MRFFNHYKTLVISDVHLGTSNDFSKLIELLNVVSCDSLIFTGDIVNGWNLPYDIHYKRTQRSFIKELLEISEKNNTRIVFTLRNEDEIDSTQDITFGKFSFFKNFSFTSGGKHYYVIPGDIGAFFPRKGYPFFETETFRYNLLLWLNDRYNGYNLRRGRNYKSLFRRFPSLKKDEDINYSFLSRYKQDLIQCSIDKDCEVIIGGHLHFPGIYHFGGISFLNPGYWSESLTVLAETNHGMWKILGYEQVMEEQKEAEKLMKLQERLFLDNNMENPGTIIFKS